MRDHPDAKEDEEAKHETLPAIDRGGVGDAQSKLKAIMGNMQLSGSGSDDTSRKTQDVDADPLGRKAGDSRRARGNILGDE